jgi:multidrug efflux pump subunit AcrA (membrane-fusion protein)
MKLRYIVPILLLIAAGSFLAGSWATFHGSRPAPAPERRILHYVDPMNPALKSDKPGIAPCGMPLEPVYADPGDSAGKDLLASMPPGTVRISPEKQQVIGVRVMKVEKAPWNHTLRVLGRVAADETRVYRINAATEGWIQDAFPVTTGSLVRKDELLATLSFFSLEYRTLIQNYFNLFNLGAAEFVGEPNQPLSEQQKRADELRTHYSAPQLKQMRSAARRAGELGGMEQINYYRKYLLNYGIGEYQLKEMERTQTFPDAVEIRSPVSGFVLSRSITPGLRLEKGAELFRIADLSEVWILADLFESEASYFKPGMRVKMELPYRKTTLHARVSSVLPQFDPATRTLRIRLTAENSGYVLRPDMPVNVELALSGPPALVVPSEAVLDSGLKKTVFVDKGNGFFEPRRVETGRSLGERVEIVGGLMPGERIAVSGHFLIDSEARMQQAALGISGEIARDPVCLMNVDADRAKAEAHLHTYKGTAYFFCSPECRDEFRKNPERYLKAPPAAGTPPRGGHDGAIPQAPQKSAASSKPRAAKQTHEAHGAMSTHGAAETAMDHASSGGAAHSAPRSAASPQKYRGAAAMPKSPSPDAAPPLPASPPSPAAGRHGIGSSMTGPPATNAGAASSSMPESMKMPMPQSGAPSPGAAPAMTAGPSGPQVQAGGTIPGAPLHPGVTPVADPLSAPGGSTMPGPGSVPPASAAQSPAMTSPAVGVSGSSADGGQSHD